MVSFKNAIKDKIIRNNFYGEHFVKFLQQLDQWNSAKQDTKSKNLKMQLGDLKIEGATKTNKFGNQNMVCGCN